MLALASAGQPSQAQSVQALPPYQRASGVSGTLSSVGSDTLANLMTLWADDFKRFYPNVNMQVQAAGSSTAPTALIERTANLGPMSRPMKNNEIQAFENRFGYAPTAVPVALDALAIFVHKDNPIEGLSLAQLDAIYSATRRCGYARDITRWGQLGLTGPWEQREIQLFGRNSVSGTYGFFKEAGLCSGDLRKNVNEQPGSGSVVQSVSASLGGIGYSGIGYVTASVRPVPIAARTDGEYVDASPANSLSGRYPLARYLLVYINKAPGRPLPPLEREFVKLMLSRVGQESVLKDGHIPLTPEQVRRTLELLDIETRL